MRPLSIIKKSLAACAVLAIIGNQAVAFEYLQHNGKAIKQHGDDIQFHGSKNGFQDQSVRDAVEIAIGRWNQSPGNFLFYDPTFNEKYLRRNNTENEMWFTSDQDLLKGSPARCHRVKVYTVNPKITETDVVWDSAVKWSFSENQYTKWNYGGEYANFISAAMHEMGHSTGLQHNNYSYNIMGSDATHVHANDGKVRNYAGEDAGSGDIYLYGAESPARNDVSVTHWKYHKASGEYSAHIETKIYPVGSNNPVPDAGVSHGLRINKVAAGGKYEVQFTYENNGKDAFHDIKTGYYISTNDRITTLDRLIKTTETTLTRNDVATIRTEVIIPADLKVGQQYYLGVILDIDNAFDEVTRKNNATYLQISIK